LNAVRLFQQFVVRQLAREPARSAATILGIALGVAVVIAIRMANDSSLRGFNTALEAMTGRTSVEIVGPPTGIDEALVADLAWLRRYGHVSPVIEGDAVLAAPLAPRGARPRGELLRVLGIDILRDQPFRDYQLLQFTARGREPTAQEFLDLLLDPQTVIVTEKLARRLGLRTGDTLALTIGDRDERFRIGGLLLDTGPARALDGNVVLMDIAAAQLALGKLGRIDRLDVRLFDPAAIDRVEAEISGRLPAGLAGQRPAQRGQQVEKMLAAFHLNLTALSCIALVVGLFLVYNTVSVSVISRRGEVGTLRALGVSRVGVLGLFLGEALVLAVVGTATGIALGRVLAWGAVGLTSTTVNALYVATAAAPPRLDASYVALAVLVGLPLSLLAAAIPAAEAARVPPLAAIRGADRIETRYRLRWRFVLWPLALLALAAWLSRLGPIRGLPLAGFAAAFACVFAAASVVPATLFALGRLGRTAMGRVFGVSGLLANSSLAGAIPRLAVSVAALAISLSMMVAIAVMIGSFRDTVVYWVGQTLKADLYIGPSARSAGARQTSISPDVAAAVRAHPDVEAVDTLRSLPIVYDGGPVGLNAIDFDVLLSRRHLLFKAPADVDRAVRAAIARGEVLVSESFSIKHGIGVGSIVALAAPGGARPFKVAGVYYDYSSDRGVIMIDRRAFATVFGDVPATGVSAYLRPGADAEAVRAEIAGGLPGDRRVYIYTNAGLRAEVLRIFDATFAITYALELIAIFVAMLGVAGTLLTLVIERRQELAMLRLVGADRAQVRRMVVLEALMLGGVSQAIGMLVGLVLSLLLIYVINVQSFGWTIQFHLPVAFLAQMTALVLVATAVSGLYPAHRASRMHVAEQVAEE
jgi:putative ABC transport system permease protein